MKIVTSFDLFPNTGSVAVSIGNFDGVHRGHEAVLGRLVSYSQENGLVSCVLTFSNHPSEVLRPNHVQKKVCRIDHKLKLLAELGIDTCLNIPFTETLAKHGPKEFIDVLKKVMPLEALILGHDARIGHQRSGDEATLRTLASEYGLYLEYLSCTDVEGQVASSTRIRAAIAEGHFDDVAKFLGRPYSIYGEVVPGAGMGRGLGYPTLNVDVSGLALPPFGVYAVKGYAGDTPFLGIANLGVAPTVRDDATPFLEVHILKGEPSVGPIEVVFGAFLRPEKRFDSKQALVSQLESDISHVRTLLGI